MSATRVTKEQLLTLRSEGYSNQEIADRLGVSYNTVLSAIGKQPKDLRRVPVRKTDGVLLSIPEPEQKKDEEEHEACMLVEDRVICLGGQSDRRYSVWISKGEIRVTGGMDVTIGFDDISELIRELQAIERKIPSLKDTIEMW